MFPPSLPPSLPPYLPSSPLPPTLPPTPTPTLSSTLPSFLFPSPQEVFVLGQELIADGTKDKDQEKLALAHIQSGWALIGAYISLGEPPAQAM